MAPRHGTSSRGCRGGRADGGVVISCHRLVGLEKARAPLAGNESV